MSFWYATYVVVGIGILVACGMCHIVWMILLPRLGNFGIRQKVLHLDNGAQTQVLVKVPGTELEEWDRTHNFRGISSDPRQMSADTVVTQKEAASSAKGVTSQ